ncbi:MAG: type II secretion system protein N [Rhodoferax sp.]|nr:type II secretion system protein N [Rhodoferax sp.]
MLALLLFAPARWLGGGLAQASGGQFQLIDARGTVWHGSAGLTLTGGPGSTDAATLPGRLDWQMRPALHAGGLALALHLSTACCVQTPWTWHLMPRWGGARLAVSDSSSQWPAQWLTGLGTPWNTIAAQGQLALRTQALTLTWASGRWQVAGSAQLDALDLSSRLSTLQPMGSYRLTLSGGPATALQLSTISGALELSGQGQWVGGRLRFTGQASSAPESQAALANLLNIIGRRQGTRSIIKVG